MEKKTATSPKPTTRAMLALLTSTSPFTQTINSAMASALCRRFAVKVPIDGGMGSRIGSGFFLFKDAGDFFLRKVTS